MTGGAQGRDPRPAGLGTLAAFPDELVCYLLHCLEVPELLRLAQASKLLRIFVCEEPLWLQKHLERCSRPFAYRGSWRATYLAYHPDCGQPELTAADLVPLAQVPGFTSAVLYRRWYRCHVDLSRFLPGTASAAAAVPSAASGALANGYIGTAAGGIPYVPDAGRLTAEEFEARFDWPGQPAMLGGLTKGWAGGSLQAWQPDSLAVAFGDRLFKASKPFLAGGRTRMRLDDYVAYAQLQADEEPLYIFDPTFGEVAPELLRLYRVPNLFRHDLFACLGAQREDYRWLVMGPARSGASWHIDPSATSAWNTLLAGRKRWALYPPGRVPPGVVVSIDPDGSPSFDAPTSLQWYLEVYPQLAPEQRPLEVVQQPGDTIFLPAGWWHAVLNLDFAVAVTQNFVSPANLAATVQWQALGAGSMFDSHLVPAYLKQRQEEQQQQEQQQPNTQHATASPQEAAGSKRCGSGGKLGGALKRRRGTCSARQEAEDHQVAVAEEAEAEEEAAAHLAELELGFRRDSALAPWLRLLLQQESEPAAPPQAVAAAGSPDGAAPDVWQLARQWTDMPAWQPRLAAACAAAGLPPPTLRHEWLPLATGWCVVFEVRNVILKFFPSITPHATAMGCMEAAAYLSLAAAAGGTSGSGAPALLHAGLLPAEPAPRTAAECVGAAGASPAWGAVPTPFLALRKVPGVTLGSCMDALSEQQWLQVAAAAGCSLAAVHRLPLPPAAAGGGGAASCTAWIARDGIAYSSLLNTVDLRDEEPADGQQQDVQQQQQQQSRELAGRQLAVLAGLFPQAAAALLGTDAAEGRQLGPDDRASAGRSPAVPEPAASGEQRAPPAAACSACERCRAWQPFVGFLRRQRRFALRFHRKHGSLPAQLQSQVEAYLPGDPATLLGCRCLLAEAGRGSEGDSPGRQADGSAVAQADATPWQPAAPPPRGDHPCVGGAMPVWVHGDLTPGNLLLTGIQVPQARPAPRAGGDRPQDEAPSWAAGQPSDGAASAGGGVAGVCSAAVIDFADSGHGDPLWDFTPLLLRTLRCNGAALRACLDAYREAWQPGSSPAGRGWPARPPGVPLSYAAMCYTLLHELDPLHGVFKRQPELWELASLEQLQAALWGWLDGEAALGSNPAVLS